MKKLLLFFTLTINLLSFSQNSSKSGSLKGNNYTNTFFDLSIKLPDTWFIQNRDKLENSNKKDSNVRTGDIIIDNENERSGLLLMANKYEIGAPVDFNPSIALLFEEISDSPGVKQESDYLFHLKKILTSKGYTISDEIGEEILGLCHFYYIVGNKELNGIKFSQTYSVLKKGHYIIGFIFTYGDGAQKTEIENIKKEILIK